MRFLGVDYGTKRIGLAISDENGALAFPKEVILSDKNIFEKLNQIIKKENISEIVVGESVNFKGEPNIVSEKIEVFILELKEKFNLPVHKQKEFLTSVEARKHPNAKRALIPSQAHSKVKINEILDGFSARKHKNTFLHFSRSTSHIKQIKSGRIDAKAAAFILQRYLDKKNQKQ